MTPALSARKDNAEKDCNSNIEMITVLKITSRMWTLAYDWDGKLYRARGVVQTIPVGFGTKCINHDLRLLSFLTSRSCRLLSDSHASVNGSYTSKALVFKTSCKPKCSL
jgi:hypothetical protein